MASAKGLFSKVLIREGWFDKTAQRAGWFDAATLGGTDAKVSWVQLEIPAGVSGGSLIPRRALWLDAGALRQISDALIGTGKKPVVILSGVLRERSTTEGVPVIIDGGSLHCLDGATEELLI